MMTDPVMRANDDQPSVWLRQIDADTDNACWVVCAKGDPGAAEFVPKPLTRIKDAR